MEQLQLIQIDGSLFEGGGQMIRSSIALSMILGKEFQIHSIRKNRPSPGINNQLRSVFSAFTEKVPKMGETETFFYPKFLSPTEIKSGTAASCSLMMQCLVPVCVGMQHDSEIKINGGTDVNKAPPLESLRLGLIPLLQRMGINLRIVDVKPGYFPTGKGYVTIAVDKCYGIKPLKMIQLTAPSKVVITYYVKDTKPPASSKQFRKEVKKILSQAFGEDAKCQVQVKHQKVFNTKDDYGIGCLILGEGMVWDVGTVGEKIAEETILGRLHQLIDKKVCLDEHHQDQLLLYAALANGTTELLIGEMSLHTESLLYVIKKFIPALQTQHENGILSIKGIAFKFPEE